MCIRDRCRSFQFTVTRNFLQKGRVYYRFCPKSKGRNFWYWRNLEKIGRRSHKRIIFFTGNWCLDRGNDSVVLYAASKCIEFWWSGNPTRHADGLSPQKNWPQTVRKIPAEIKSVLQCGKPVFLGCSRRFYSWHEGFCTKKAKETVGIKIQSRMTAPNNM